MLRIFNSPVDVRVIVDAQPAGVITHHCPVDNIDDFCSNCFTQDNGYHHNPGGGCQIQQMSYQAQLRFKEKLDMDEAFRSIISFVIR